MLFIPTLQTITFFLEDAHISDKPSSLNKPQSIQSCVASVSIVFTSTLRCPLSYGPEVVPVAYQKMR